MESTHINRPKTRGNKVFEFKTDKVLVEGFYELRHDDGNYPYQVLYTDLTKAEGEHRYELEEANNDCIWETAANYFHNVVRIINSDCLEAWRKVRSEDYAKANAKGKRRRRAA